MFVARALSGVLFGCPTRCALELWYLFRGGVGDFGCTWAWRFGNIRHSAASAGLGFEFWECGVYCNVDRSGPCEKILLFRILC